VHTLLAIPVATLALAGAQPRAPTIDGAEAIRALSRQVRKHAEARLRGGFQSEAVCSGSDAEQRKLTPETERARWHCTLEISGARFPSPCRAQAYLVAAGPPHRVRIEGLAMSRYCRAQ
jgi:hypothetical protein